MSKVPFVFKDNIFFKNWFKIKLTNLGKDMWWGVTRDRLIMTMQHVKNIYKDVNLLKVGTNEMPFHLG
jgi:hypothetical protein